MRRALEERLEVLEIGLDGFGLVVIGEGLVFVFFLFFFVLKFFCFVLFCFCFVLLVFMFVDFRVFDIVMSKRSNESEGDLCEKTNKVVVALNEVMKHSFGQTFSLVFVIISFCMGVYLAQGEKNNSV